MTWRECSLCLSFLASYYSGKLFSKSSSELNLLFCSTYSSTGLGLWLFFNIVTTTTWQYIKASLKHQSENNFTSLNQKGFSTQYLAVICYSTFLFLFNTYAQICLIQSTTKVVFDFWKDPNLTYLDLSHLDGQTRGPDNQPGNNLNQPKEAKKPPAKLIYHLIITKFIVILSINLCTVQ